MHPSIEQTYRDVNALCNPSISGPSVDFMEPMTEDASVVKITRMLAPIAMDEHIGKRALGTTLTPFDHVFADMNASSLVAERTCPPFSNYDSAHVTAGGSGSIAPGRIPCRSLDSFYHTPFHSHDIPRAGYTLARDGMNGVLVKDFVGNDDYVNALLKVTKGPASLITGTQALGAISTPDILVNAGYVAAEVLTEHHKLVASASPFGVAQWGLTYAVRAGSASRHVDLMTSVFGSKSAMNPSVVVAVGSDGCAPVQPRVPMMDDAGQTDEDAVPCFPSSEDALEPLQHAPATPGRVAGVKLTENSVSLFGVARHRALRFAAKSKVIFKGRKKVSAAAGVSYTATPSSVVQTSIDSNEGAKLACSQKLFPGAWVSATVHIPATNDLPASMLKGMTARLFRRHELEPLGVRAGVSLVLGSADAFTGME
ncbi:hypothetical protein J8273_2337 [Carpediemonas membranifera]|uniref:Uncharacterized protein n=1 Tax=Carpediemonas membranifera TaxID=201153 RepID=A0A8J6B5B8_9EUKA|nr:hypothetical protein J8273_2337 [Carpediemonas membranifera]|eukprot:KAG9395988.1 hypothetical protein J8273_2337 [Carpediemonas membranifera]